MNLTKRKSQAYDVVATIPAGLAELARAFHKRHVIIGSITLKRGGQTYEHKIIDNCSNTHLIEAHFESVTIIVSCLSPISGDLAEMLQARTNYAAIAAASWKDIPTQLKLVEETAPRSKMTGTSKQLRELIADISRAARSTHAVLILGESGTGKTTAASMIHEASARASQRFVDVNCAAIPDTLVESELFGHEKGAFTGAMACKRGLFEMADGGTLFLDEIGELKFELQAKLLTAIEQQKIRRLGGTVDIKCNVRILVASSRDLQRMVIEGKFREDLYYRLAVLEISIPPLRDRREDIPILVHERLIHEQQRSATPNAIEIEDAAIKELASYDWPGNIRQLHNVIARLSTHADKNTPITARSTRKEIARFNQASKKSCTKNDESIFLPAECRMLLPGESLKQFNARVNRKVIETVRDCTGSMKAASARLDFDRSALSKLLSRLSAHS
jgi:transcriptional regulator with PAS, ATPase and Fis domain